jgi:hypothetical protein
MRVAALYDIHGNLPALEGQLRQVVGKSDWQSLYVINTNLTIIQANVTNMPRVSSN